MAHDAEPQLRRRRMKILGIVLLMLGAPMVLAGVWYVRCFVVGFSIDPDLLQGPIGVVPLDAGALDPTYEIPAGSVEHARIVEWLRANRGGWVYDMKDYSPHTGLWTPKLRISLAQDRVCIGYDNNPRPSYLTWVSKRIPNSEHPAIPRAGSIIPISATTPRGPGEFPAPGEPDPVIVPSPAPQSAPR